MSKKRVIKVKMVGYGEDWGGEGALLIRIK
jgi:hypothetical protein